MSRQLGSEFRDFQTALDEDPVTGLRVNSLKITAQEYQARTPLRLGEPIPWAPGAYILPPSDLSAGNHAHHRAGLFYLQDPSAMAPAALLDPGAGERVLDLAAAPGGKTTHLAALMGTGGLLVANEIKDKRVGHLAMNVERWGASNVVTTNESPERLVDHFGATFDRVLVDAPCSGEGMFRKDMGARLDWSPEVVRGCALRQKNILSLAAKLVKAGGRLMYSTCTFATEEDEEIILAFLKTHPGYEVVPLPDLPGSMRGQPGWMEGAPGDVALTRSLEGALRLFPHRIAGEGHFICLMQKTGAEKQERIHDPQWKSRESPLADMDCYQERLFQDFWSDLQLPAQPAAQLKVWGERLYLVPEDMPDPGSLRLIHPGTWIGRFKTGRFEPAHPLALRLQANQVGRVVDLMPGEARLDAYLHGEVLASEGEDGWVLVCVDGFGLGWGKRVQGRLKNHYPKGWMQSTG